MLNAKSRERCCITRSVLVVCLVTLLSWKDAAGADWWDRAQVVPAGTGTLDISNGAPWSAYAAVPSAGYYFMHWRVYTNGMDLYTAENPYMWQDGDIEPTHVYFATNQCTITTVASNGYVMGGGTYGCGARVHLSAMPSNGYYFAGWSGAATGTEDMLLITCDSNMTVTADFEAHSGTWSHWLCGEVSVEGQAVDTDGMDLAGVMLRATVYGLTNSPATSDTLLEDGSFSLVYTNCARLDLDFSKPGFRSTSRAYLSDYGVATPNVIAYTNQAVRMRVDGVVADLVNYEDILRYEGSTESLIVADLSKPYGEAFYSVSNRLSVPLTAFSVSCATDASGGIAVDSNGVPVDGVLLAADPDRGFIEYIPSPLSGNVPEAELGFPDMVQAPTVGYTNSLALSERDEKVYFYFTVTDAVSTQIYGKGTVWPVRDVRDGGVETMVQLLLQPDGSRNVED